MIELITVIIMLGILSVVAIPRLNTSGYRAVEFHDKVVSALRFAQKSAVSHRRAVCATFPDDHTLVLMIDTNKDGTCETALIIPGGGSNQVVSSAVSEAFFTPVPAALTFAADGTSSSGAITVSGATAIAISGTTGYVQ